jgi:methionine synthase II (cobalamin-independent)
MSPAHRMHPPFRADHVGSLLRPKALRDAHKAHEAGALDDAGFRTAQDAAIREAVALQEGLGLHGITDGEFRRASYWSHFVEATDGLAVARSRFDFHDDAGRLTQFMAPLVTGPVRRARSISGAEFDFLKGATTQTPKLTMPSPPTMHFWGAAGQLRAAGYRDEGTYFADLAEVYRAEIADLARRGLRYLQLDEVPLAMLCDPQMRARVQRDGQDPDALVGLYVDAFNAALRGRPAGLTVGMHLCRGNFKGQWLAQGSYQHVAERMFAGIDVDAFFLEYDTPRAGDFAPLDAVPAGKFVVLGLVSTKRAALEDAAQLKRRIEDAARHVPLERLALSPQCGFASTVAGNPVTEDDERAKLGLVRDVAREVWGAD